MSSAAPPIITPNNYTVINSPAGFKLQDVIVIPTGKNIAIFNTTVMSGQIEVKTASGSTWSPLSAVTKSSAVVQTKDSFMKFTHSSNQLSYYGVVIVNFVLTSESSGTYNVPSSSIEKKLLILVSPNKIVPKFNSTTTLDYELQEDSLCIPMQPSNSSRTQPHGLKVKPFMFDENRFEQFRTDLNESVFLTFQNTVRSTYSSYKLAYWIKSVTRGTGRWFYMSGSRTPFEDSFATTKKVIETHQFAFCFVPAPDVFGEVSMVLSPVFIDGSTQIFGTEEVTVKITINATNDRPVVSISVLDIPALPYNFTGFVNSGFTVANLLKKTIRGVETSAFTDKDGDTVGVAVVSAPITSYGTWEYKCGSSAWQPLNVNYTPPLVNVSTLDMVLLQPNDSIRFILANESSYWTTITAIQNQVALQVLAWDQTDGQSCGTYQHSQPNPWPLSFSSKKNFAEGIQLRKGCDGRPGYVLKFDVCGVCGGNADCLGCDGVPNSGAIIDSCNNCTGGTTSVSFNYRLDCGSTCGDYTTDACGVCVLKGSSEDFRDCNGDCYGDAVINDCGTCAGGNTSKPLNFGKDACGLCGGDNSTCVDCSGVPNGLKVVDLCGICLLKSDPAFNTGCVKLGTFTPTVFYKDQLSSSAQITIQGSGSIPSAACVFVHSVSGTSTNAASATVASKIITAVLPSSLVAGNYSVQCTIGGNVKVASSDLFIVDPSSMTVSSLSSDVVYHSQSEIITVTGTGFLNTGQLACLFVKKDSDGSWKKHGKELEAVYQSGTEITCHVKPITTSISGQLAVSFIKKDRGNHLSLNATFHRSINMSSTVSGAFSDSLGSLLITFSGPIDLKNKSATCQDIFPSTYTSFGSNPVCKARGNVFAIVLDGIDATFTPGNVVVQMNELIVKRADYTIYPTTTSTVNIPVPPNAKAPNMIIVAPNMLGRCDKLVVRSRKQKGGGRKLTYSWAIEWVSTSASPTANQQSAIDAINTNLDNLPAFSPKIEIPSANLTDYLLQIDIGIVLNVTNFLGKTGTFKATVRRENKDLPKLILSTKKLEILASQKVSLKAQVSLPACGGTGDAQVTYLWSLLNADGTTASVTLKNTDTPNFKIAAASLVGGKTYNARVDVTMKADPSQTTYDTIEIVVKSSQLVARIDGVQTVGSTETLSLSGKNCLDPDGVTTPAPLYQWRILTEDGGTVIKGRIQIMSDLTTNTRDISIDVARYLTSNKKYKIELIYQVGDRKATDELIVSVLAGSPPRVNINSLDGPQVPSKVIRLSATINSPSAVQGDPEWSTTNGAKGTRIGDTIGTVYKLESNSLDEASSYEYSLSVTNVDATAVSSIAFKTNSKPTTGAISLSPSTGEAFNTKFTIAADESGGWSDPDGDEVTFEFGFIESTQNLEVVLGDKQASKFLEGARMPEGSHQVYVKCCDVYGSCTMKTTPVVITSVSINSAFFDNVDAERQKLRDMQDFSKMSASGVTALNIMLAASSKRRRRRSISGVNCNGLSDSTINSQTATLNDHLLPYENGKIEFDESSRNLFIERMGTFTQCGYTIFSADLIKRSHDALAAIIGDFVSRTNVQVQADLTSFDNLILATRYDSNTQTAKSVFRSTASRQTQRMCLGMLAGEAAGVVERTLANLQSVQLTLSETEANWTQLGCSSCGNGVKPSYIDISGFKNNYGSPKTGGSQQYQGLCLSSIQYPTDLLDTSFNSSMLSPVLEVKFWDSKTSQHALNISSDIQVDLPIKTETNNSYMCLTWDSSSSSWTAGGVTTPTGLPFTKNSLNYVRCSMSTLAPIALFEGPARISPTSSSSIVASATAMSNASVSASIQPSSSVPVMNASVAPNTTAATTTLQPQDFPRKVSLTFPFNNCSSSILNASVLLNIKTQIASLINVSANTLTNFNATCGSLIVTYLQIHTTNKTAASAIASLQQALQDNKLNITVNGIVLTADKSSLVVNIQTPNYATTTTTTTTTVVPPATTEDDGLSGGAIAGIVIGVLIFILILGVIIYFVCCKKNSRKDNTVEPNENDVELRGKSNKGYSGGSP